jgi:hypothetical protein
LNRRHRRRLLLAAAAVGLTACRDPVHDDAVDALGLEQAGVPPGPMHRPGQPCLVCHGGNGPGSPTFSVAGTIFETPGELVALPGTLVRLADGDGDNFSAWTNEAGNFYLRPGDFAPNYPLWISLERDGAVVEMKTPSYREGSCAGCHSDPSGPDSVGHVYFTK